jgi:hypothetical protein
VYYTDYTVASTHAIEGLLIEWTITEGTVARKHGAGALVVDTTAVDFTAADRTKLELLATDYTTTRAGYLDNLSGGAAALEATLTAIKGSGWSTETLKAIKVLLDTAAADVAGLDGAAMRGTDSAALASICTEARLAELDAANLPTDVAARTGFKLASDGVDAIVAETGLNLRQAIVVIAAATVGKLSGAATTTITIKAAQEGATNRIVATVDADGNRSAVTLTLPT